MILARITFHAKFGMAGQIVEMMKQDQSFRGDTQRTRLMTDHGGRFDTVILEIESESIADHERGRAEMFKNPHFQQNASKMQELIDWGSIDFFNIVE